ncbi:MAG: nucleoside-diphosphate kinase [Firmicutes bacterium]|nr:nucleoside-diphosphate kinase [Bacillota bacterium]
MEKTFVMIKPDGVKRQLTGEIIRRFEAKGMKLVAIKKMQVEPPLAREHYQEHQGKPFFERLVEHICSGPVVAMIWQGENAVKLARLMIGHRDPLQALPGTIRGDFAMLSTENLVHGADSIEAAQREASLFFGGIEQ